MDTFIPGVEVDDLIAAKLLLVVLMWEEHGVWAKSDLVSVGQKVVLLGVHAKVDKFDKSCKLYSFHSRQLGQRSLILDGSIFGKCF